MRTQNFTTTLPGEQKQISTSYFWDKDDELPMHVHPFWHSCMVLKGSVEVSDPTGKSAVVMSGYFCEFAAGRHHKIKALEDGTITVHTNEPGK